MDASIPVYREIPHECPYLPDVQCSNLRFELAQSSPEFLDILLERGFRHFGDSFFRPECPGCEACVGIRIPVDTFKPNRSQRRCLRDNTDLVLDMGPVIIDEERLDLLNRFQLARWLDKNWSLIEYDEEQYRSSFCWDANLLQELIVRDQQGKLLAVGIVDFTQTTASATYHFHDPQESRRGLGTWLLLRELELLKTMQYRYLYLGLWNGQCKSLDYKRRFLPHELLVDGEWLLSEKQAPNL